MPDPVFPETSRCLAKKYLTPQIYESLKHLATDSGFTIDQAIHSGVMNSDSSIGIYAGDAMSYETFKPVFEPLVHEYHGSRQHISTPDGSDTPNFPNPDSEGHYIISTRIRAARNIEGFDFTPHIDAFMRRRVEKKILSGFENLKNRMDGNYFPLSKIDPSAPFFPKGDRFQEAAGINRDFPECRGVFQSEDKKLSIWVNEEDHLRIITLRQDADIAKTYHSLIETLSILECSLEFARSDEYGYLTSCPTNLGTAMRAGVHIRLEKLAENMHILHDIVETSGLQIRGTRGEKTQVENSLFDISNKHRLGIDEKTIISRLWNGIRRIIKKEKSL